MLARVVATLEEKEMQRCRDAEMQGRSIIVPTYCGERTSRQRVMSARGRRKEKDGQKHIIPHHTSYQFRNIGYQCQPTYHFLMSCQTYHRFECAVWKNGRCSLDAKMIIRYCSGPTACVATTLPDDQGRLIGSSRYCEKRPASPAAKSRVWCFLTVQMKTEELRCIGYLGRARLCICLYMCYPNL
ncbi:hypothetical protein EJ02DRAFT_139524 [Clathrospora elynae]|uniref:Uncharacterized protein n=1 Tax=Clathrospora elynae TaxID=706981 RepID=A0A6A5T5C9_9PLEO|nr:hypothetical protein EJ02DRAFT_139524 [Clathrospora elynae]